MIMRPGQQQLLLPVSPERIARGREGKIDDRARPKGRALQKRFIARSSRRLLHPRRRLGLLYPSGTFGRLVAWGALRALHPFGSVLPTLRVARRDPGLLDARVAAFDRRPRRHRCVVAPTSRSLRTTTLGVRRRRLTIHAAVRRSCRCRALRSHHAGREFADGGCGSPRPFSALYAGHTTFRSAPRGSRLPRTSEDERSVAPRPRSTAAPRWISGGTSRPRVRSTPRPRSVRGATMRGSAHSVHWRRRALARLTRDPGRARRGDAAILAIGRALAVTTVATGHQALANRPDAELAAHERRLRTRSESSAPASRGHVRNDRRRHRSRRSDSGRCHSD